MGHNTMTNYTSLDEDADAWKTNFMAGISQIPENHYSDVDALARSLSQKIPNATALDADEGREELEDQVDGDGLRQLQRILDKYENNSDVPSTDEIKQLIVQRASNVDYDPNQDLDDQLSTALDEFASDWQNNWSASFGF